MWELRGSVVKFPDGRMIDFWMCTPVLCGARSDPLPYLTLHVKLSLRSLRGWSLCSVRTVRGISGALQAWGNGHVRALSLGVLLGYTAYTGPLPL